MRKSKEAATQSPDTRDSSVGHAGATAPSMTVGGTAPSPEQSQAGTDDVGVAETQRLLDLGQRLSADGQHAEAEQVFCVLLSEGEKFGREGPGVFAMTRSVAE